MAVYFLPHHKQIFRTKKSKRQLVLQYAIQKKISNKQKSKKRKYKSKNKLQKNNLSFSNLINSTLIKLKLKKFNYRYSLQKIGECTVSDKLKNHTKILFMKITLKFQEKSIYS